MQKNIEEINNIEPMLKPTTYGMTYYEILGVNIDANKTEMDENYQHIKQFMSTYKDYFTDAEKNKVDEAYKTLTSMLSSIWYEKNLDTIAKNNTIQQYLSKKNTLEMFKKIHKQIGNYVLVNYIEIVNGEKVHNKLYGDLNHCNNFNNIIVDTNFDIPFLGPNSAIIEIFDNNKQKIYENKYLKNPEILANYNSHTYDIFRQTSWSYYISSQIQVLEKEKNKIDSIFQKLDKAKDKMIIVDYLTRESNELVNNKIIGSLTAVNKYNNVTIDHKHVINFADNDTVIIKIYDTNGNILYENKYLQNNATEKKYNFSSEQELLEKTFGYLISEEVNTKRLVKK